jgi:DNA-binding protein H-NS
MSVHGHLELEVWSLHATHFHSGLRPETLKIRHCSSRQTKEPMKSQKLEKYSLDEFFEQREKRERKINPLQLASTQELYVELVALAQTIGITLRQLTQRARASWPLFYVNPNNVSQQWWGRGTKPQWLLDWQRSGKLLDMVRM